MEPNEPREMSLAPPDGPSGPATEPGTSAPGDGEPEAFETRWTDDASVVALGAVHGEYPTDAGESGQTNLGGFSIGGSSGPSGPDSPGPGASGLAARVAAARVKPTIPGYEIEGELGRGGMGVVYKAHQFRLNRPCALKMIRAGVHAGTQALLRFLAEAEAVAKLQHPNVVQIYHIGEVSGLPFLELEYLAGGSLDKTLAGTPWPARAAAKLMEPLARAMHEAHRLGIIHRDLKPANILLTADGTPKITDFGLAKAPHAEQGLTQTESAIGTPSYMAPEQTGGRAKEVGPAADVYALGVILYEVLVGRPPFKAATMLETLEQVRNAEPVPPSKLQPGLPRDLETICLKCLEKEPAQRYESAGALADDLGRFLSDRPIQARPVSATERALRWCRRNPWVAGLTTTVAVLLLALVVGWAEATVSLARSAEDARRALLKAEAASTRARGAEARALTEARRANHEAEASKQVAQFLVGLFDANDVIGAGSGSLLSGSGGADLSAREVVDRGAQRLEGQLRDNPAVRATLLDTIGKVYISLGRLDRAESLLATALELRRKALGPDDLDLAATLHNLGVVRSIKTDPAGEAPFREALAIRRKRLGDDHLLVAETMFDLGFLLRGKAGQAGDAEGERLTEAALAIRRKRLGPGSREVAASLLLMAWLDFEAHQGARGIPRVLEASRILDEATGRHDFGTIVQRFMGARIQEQLGNTAGALKQYVECKDLLAKRLGPDHVMVAYAAHAIADIHLARHEPAAAEAAFREARAAFRRVFGDDHQFVGSIVLDLARSVRDQGRYAEAIPLALEALRVCRASHSNRLAQSLHVLGGLFADTNAFDEAEPLLREATELRLADVDRNPWSAVSALRSLGYVQDSKGDHAGARSTYLRALTIAREHPRRDRELNQQIADLERLIKAVGSRQ
jgi:tetratricopeptide (TPR) repeat protein